MVFSPALYNDLYVKTTLNLVTLVFQETGDKTKKTSVHCGLYNARAVTNDILQILHHLYYNTFQMTQVVFAKYESEIFSFLTIMVL